MLLEIYTKKCIITLFQVNHNIFIWLTHKITSTDLILEKAIVPEDSKTSTATVIVAPAHTICMIHCLI